MDMSVELTLGISRIKNKSSPSSCIYYHTAKRSPLECLTSCASRQVTSRVFHKWDQQRIQNRLQLSLAILSSSRRNLNCALEQPSVVDKYLTEELSNGRLAGLFNPSEIPIAHISRFEVIPKNHQPNKWHLIVDLSHPSGHSINDGIPKDLCSLTYITADTAIDQIMALGKSTLLAKIDIKSAFCLLPVHPADRHLLAIKWRQQLYIDTYLTFGLRSAPKLFNVLADLLTWILGPPNSPLSNLNTIKEVCQRLGVPLALKEVDGPSQILTYLQIFWIQSTWKHAFHMKNCNEFLTN